MKNFGGSYLTLPGIGKKQLLLVARRRVSAVSVHFRWFSNIYASWRLLSQRDVEDGFRSVERRLHGAGRHVGAVMLLDAQLFAYEVGEVERLARGARLPVVRAGNGSSGSLSRACCALRALTTPGFVLSDVSAASVPSAPHATYVPPKKEIP